MRFSYNTFHGAALYCRRFFNLHGLKNGFQLSTSRSDGKFTTCVYIYYLSSGGNYSFGCTVGEFTNS